TGGVWAARAIAPPTEASTPASDQCLSLAPRPTRRGGLTAANLDGRIHVLGGEAFDPSRTFPEHEVYDPSIDAWTTAEPLPTPRHGLGSAVLDGALFIIGGRASRGLSTSTGTH